MNTYYKYTKYFGLDSLKEMTIRLSPPRILNDPFETLFNEDVQNQLSTSVGKNYYSEHLDNVFDTEDKKNSYIKYRINDSVNRFGIISLSETHRNLLMWAHYAHEHKGLCIGFHSDFISRLPNKFIDDNEIAEYKPIKVNYDSIRPQHISDISNKKNELRINTINQLITKSNDWIYEKEHRCVIPLNWADKLKIINESELDDLDIQVLEIFKDTVEKSDDGYLYFKGDEEKKIALCSAFARDSNVAFLKKIDPLSIKSIHIGCRMPYNDVVNIIESIKDESHPLHHIQLYMYEESNERYELIEKELIFK